MEFASEACRHLSGGARAAQLRDAVLQETLEVQPIMAPELYPTLDLLRWAGECEGLELEPARAMAPAAKAPQCDRKTLEWLCWAGEGEAVGLERDPALLEWLRWATNANGRHPDSELLLWEGECEDIELVAVEPTASPEKESEDVAMKSPCFEGEPGEGEHAEFKTQRSTIDSSQLTEEHVDGEEADSQFREPKSPEQDDEASTRAPTRPSTQPSTRPPTPTQSPSPRPDHCWSALLVWEGECEEIVSKLAQISSTPEGLSGCTAALRPLPWPAAEVEQEACLDPEEECHVAAQRDIVQLERVLPTALPQKELPDDLDFVGSGLHDPWKDVLLP